MRTERAAVVSMITVCRWVVLLPSEVTTEQEEQEVAATILLPLLVAMLPAVHTAAVLVMRRIMTITTTAVRLALILRPAVHLASVMDSMVGMGTATMDEEIISISIIHPKQ